LTIANFQFAIVNLQFFLGMPMQIVHFVHRYPPALGGSEAFFARLSRHMAALGDQVCVETTTALDLEAFWSSKARVLPAGTTVDHQVTVRRHALAHWPGRRFLLKLLSLLPIRPLQALTLPCNPISPSMWHADPPFGNESGVDVVHATAFPYAWPIFCGLRLARRHAAPFVLTPFLHLGDPRNPQDRTRRAYLSPAMRFLLRSADCVFAQTPLEHEAILDAGISAGRVRLLGMGVDPAECTGGDRRRARARWGLPADAIVIGHLANKSAEKGTLDLLQASEVLTRNGTPHRLLLAGPEMPNFVQYWKRLSSALGVTRLGVLTEMEKRDFYAAIDLFALPSRSDSFGLVFLEAWANGVPSVAYRAGGVANVVRHGRDGLLADCGDIAGLAAALEALIRDGPRRMELGNTGRQRVLTEFRWTPRLEFVRQTYAELIAAGSSISCHRGRRRRTDPVLSQP
jgi:glycosyltransferase involved in cell wall biosynthesis